MANFASTSSTHSDRGAILLIVAGSISLLLLIALVVINIARIVHLQSEAQVVVDAAAIAGAGGIRVFTASNGMDRSAIDGLVNAYNRDPSDPLANLVAGQNPAIPISSSNVIPVQFIDHQNIVENPIDPRFANGVRVVKDDWFVDLYLGSLIGYPTYQVKASATAAIGGPACAEPRLPIALIDCPYPDINNAAAPCGSTNSVDPLVGRFQPPSYENIVYFDFVEDGPNNANRCKRMVDEEHPQGPIDIPELCYSQVMELNTGNITSCHDTAIDEFCEEINANGCVHGGTCGDPSYDPDLLDPNCRWIIDVPVIACDDAFPGGSGTGGGNLVQQAPIAGFAKLAIVNVHKETGSSGGNFIDYFILEDEVDVLGGGYECGVHTARPVLVQ